MDSDAEKILIMDGDEFSRGNLETLLRGAGYAVSTAEICQVGLKSARENSVDLVVLDAALPGMMCADLLAELKGASPTAGTRVILLEAGDAQTRARDLDLGADDVLARPWDPIEMLAHVRLQLRAKKAQDSLRERTVIAESGQELSRTAFQALAVTEKMSRDADSLGRGLKWGLAALFVVVAVMAAIYFRFSRTATNERRRSYAMIAGLNNGLTREEDLIAQVHKVSEQINKLEGEQTPAKRETLEHQSRQLRAQIAGAPPAETAALRDQLQRTEAALRRAQSGATVAEGIIRSYAPSVCLIHVAVAIREKSGQRHLRYAGLTPEGEPIKDEKGAPELSLDGFGPEVQVHALGTGFLARPQGRVITNHHVIEPWWNNDEMGSLARQGLEPVVFKIEAYFPGSPRSFAAATEQISSDADVAVVRVSLGDLKREVLTLDPSESGSMSGQPVVLMGYPTGLDAILARANEATVQEIVKASHGELTNVLAELAQKNLIRPVITQGHVGDVLPDKIIYDAQTTYGGSGGPLFNEKGKVIGINYAVLQDFGGSNFGIPVRYAQALLLH